MKNVKRIPTPSIQINNNIGIRKNIKYFKIKELNHDQHILHRCVAQATHPSVEHYRTGILHHSHLRCHLPLRHYASVVLHYLHSALLFCLRDEFQPFSSSFFLFFHLPFRSFERLF
ncbi:hypothetical protein C0J52_25118 [Blattella germanica]|nr:hypothetical protein C0J52_25118 [Blattella germanica]